MLNVVALTGRLVADPELKQTPSGTSVLSFTIAVNRSFANKEGKREADFIDLVAWRNTAEFISRYFNKGNMIGIQGSIQTRTYTDKNDNKRKAVEILVDRASFVESKGSGGGGGYQDNDFGAKPNNAPVYPGSNQGSTGGVSQGSADDFSSINTEDQDMPF